MMLDNQSGSISEDFTKLELFFSCRSLTNMDTFSQSDPYIVMQLKKNNQWFEYGRTETIYDHLNPNFSKTLQVDYHFEIQQYLKFLVYDYDGPDSSDFIGSCETTLGAIAGAKDQLLVLDIKNGHGKNGGKLIIRADQVKMINDKIQLVISGQKLVDTRFGFWQKISPFLRFYRLKSDNDQPLLVYESEYIKQSTHPQWKQIDIKAQKLCNGDYNMPIKIEVWDHISSGKHTLLGQTRISVLELQNSGGNINRELKNNSNKKVGLLLFTLFKLIEIPSFLQYIAGGTQINLIIAIDFTASNQNPQHKTSLHYQDPQGQLNQYQQAIVSVGEILLNYDHDKKVPVYGFGCRPHLPTLTSNQTLHCFPINGNPSDPEVYGIPGIMQAYQYVLPNVKFDGPTYFNPIISEAMTLAKTCKDESINAYFVLLIITDGEIHDMQATINSIIASSHLPLSIIIVGVGVTEFHSMKVLDNDDGSMRDDKGRKSKRDLVQFVPFNEFRNDPTLLAKNVLQELPDQLVQYMMLVNKKPMMPKQISLTNYLMNDSQIQINLRNNQPQQQQEQQQQYQQSQQQQQYQQQQGQSNENPYPQINQQYQQPHQQQNEQRGSGYQYP